MVGHMGGVDEIGLAGEVESDLREHIGRKTVKGRLEGIDVTTQHRERGKYIVLYSLQLKK